MAYKLIQNFTKVNFTKGNSGRKYIVIHYTGNKTDKATSNGNYFKNANRGASAHYFVDDTTVVQVVSENDTAWAVGRNYGSNNLFGKCTNSNSISIEMCSTNGRISDATYQNTVALVKSLMKKYNIDAAHVVRHWDVCSKSCPGWTGWGANGCDASIWNQFKKDIVSANSGKGVGTVRKLTPGKAFLYCDAPIYKRDWKTVIINGHKGDKVTIMDKGTGGVKVKYNDTIGYMNCEYLMPYISTGDLLEVVEDFTVTIRKGTVLRAADKGYLGNRVTIHKGNVSIDDRFVQKV
mgnify:FL=1